MRARFGAVVTLAIVAFVGGCTGEGSDIGPDIPRLTAPSYRVLVLDGQGRGVVGAGVSLSGTNERGVTGRVGRAEIAAAPSGAQVITVDATNASATATDRLFGYAVNNALAPAGDQLDFVVYLPDLSASNGLVVTSGASLAGATLDDSATSGARLVLAAGEVVAVPDAPQFVIRTGLLDPLEAPPAAYPPSLGDAPLASRVIAIGPAATTFTLGGTLVIPNDLALPPSARTTLFRLRDDGAIWENVASAVVDATGATIRSNGGVLRGGLYAFAIVSTGSTEIVGRVLDTEGDAVPNALVRVPGAFTRTQGDGTFALPVIATEDGQGRIRTVPLQVTGGRDYWPVDFVTPRDVRLTAARVGTGPIELDTERVSVLRGLVLNRGRVDVGRRVRVSATEANTFGVAISGDDGQLTIEDLEVGFWSYVGTRLDPRDMRRVLSMQGSVFVDNEARSADVRLFQDEQEWLVGRGGGTAVFILDRDGTGIVEGAGLTNNRLFEEERTEGFVIDVGVLRADFGDAGDGTAIASTTADGLTVLSASSVFRPESGRLELGVARANRAPIGVFDRHALFEGTFPAGIGNTPRVRATRRLALDDWFDDVFNGRPSTGTAPLKVDPATSASRDMFVAGVPGPTGNLVAIDGNVNATGVFELRRVWVFPDLDIEEGTRRGLAFDAGIPATTSYRIRSALDDLNPNIDPTDLRVAVAAETASGVVDLARDVGGNHRAVGTDVVVDLPGRVGPLTDSRLLVALSGTGMRANGTVVRQAAFAPFAAGETETVVSLPRVPAIVSPAPGETLSVEGFTAQWTVPAGTLYVELQLRQDLVTVVRDWTVVLPADRDRYSFRRLPADVSSVLASGNWRLSVTAHRVETGRLTVLEQPYQLVVARRVSMSDAEREVNGYSSSTLQVTLR